MKRGVQTEQTHGNDSATCVERLGGCGFEKRPRRGRMAVELGEGPLDQLRISFTSLRSG